MNLAINVLFFFIVWLRKRSHLGFRERNNENFPTRFSNKISLQPHTSLCIYLLDKKSRAKTIDSLPLANHDGDGNEDVAKKRI